MSTDTTTSTTAQHADKRPDPTEEEVRDALPIGQRVANIQRSFNCWGMLALIAGVGISSSTNFARETVWFVFGLYCLGKMAAIMSRNPIHRAYNRIGMAPSVTWKELRRELVYGDSGGDGQ